MKQNFQQGEKAQSQNNNLLPNSQIVNSSKIYPKLSNSFSMEVQQPRISEQLIIIKDEGQKALISSIICPICLLTLPLPYYECQQCNNSFCPNCIEDWWGKHPNSTEKQCIFKCQNGILSPNEATFKKVKRSNTYVALMNVLQFKCGSCNNLFPLSSYQKHNLLECPETDIQCSHLDCKILVKRKSIEQHEKQCEFRLQKCQYCNETILYKDLILHEQILCSQRMLVCENKGCEKNIKLKEFQDHRKVCQFQILCCPWCKDPFRKFELPLHEINCESKVIQCEWCKQVFKLSQFQVHNCELKEKICKLCLKGVLVSQMKQHRNDCIFQNMVKLKQQNQMLLEQNKKLHYKINDLQEQIEEYILSKQFIKILDSEGKALQVIQKFKLKEKQQLEKDMQRINNSMNSINKLRDEEIEKHMEKIRHIFGSSLCIQCKLLEKKFMQMKEPLLKKRRQIQQKINEIDSVYETVKGE